VNGSYNGLVELTIEPPCYTPRQPSTLFHKMKVSSLTISLVDPDGSIAALDGGTQAAERRRRWDVQFRGFEVGLRNPSFLR